MKPTLIILLILSLGIFSCSNDLSDITLYDENPEQNALQNGLNDQVKIHNGLKATPPNVGHGFVADNPAVAKELSRLKKKVANLRTLEQVKAAGWEEDLTGYVPNMGYHYVNWDFINDGVFNIEEPEAILIACGPNGELVAIAVEYLVPIQNIDDPEPAPSGFSGNADTWKIVGPFWTLHTWIKKPNPEGIFYPTNPEVAITDECSDPE